MKKWDVFISHASEDKEDIAAPLAAILSRAGITVWLDTVQLNLGDSLREKIDEGLANCRFGAVVLSPSFLNKKWPSSELNGLFAREMNGQKVILPIWHNCSQKDIAETSPMMADRLAVTTDRGLQEVAAKIINSVLATDESSQELPHSILRKFNDLLTSFENKSVIRDFLAYHHPIIEHAVGATSSLEVRTFISPNVAGFRPDFVVFEYCSTLGDIEIHIVQLSSIDNIKLSNARSPTDVLSTDLRVMEGAYSWFNENGSHLEEGGWLARLTGTIACGRRDELSNEQKRKLRELNESFGRIRIRTYDWLVDAAAAYFNAGIRERRAYRWSQLMENKQFKVSDRNKN